MNLRQNISFVCYYPNAYEERRKIYKENKNKTGIYLWINLVSGKSYLGSSVNLSRRFQNYFNKAYLIREVKKNNSLIYKALLKYDYSNFRLEILEYCDIESLLKREQYYLNNLDLKYNTLKIAGSILGFKHSSISKERIRNKKLGQFHSETTKLKLAANIKAIGLEIVNIETEEIIRFPSIRRTANFLKINHSYLAKCIKKNLLFECKGYLIKKSK